MLHTEYYKDGTPCVCDEMDRKYHLSGALLREVPFKNGQISGTEMCYFKSGAVNSEHPYLDGMKHGIEKWFSASGIQKVSQDRDP